MRPCRESRSKSRNGCQGRVDEKASRHTRLVPGLSDHGIIRCCGCRIDESAVNIETNGGGLCYFRAVIDQHLEVLRHDPGSLEHPSNTLTITLGPATFFPTCYSIHLVKNPRQLGKKGLGACTAEQAFQTSQKPTHPGSLQIAEQQRLALTPI